jgi:hypothetical protein
MTQIIEGGVITLSYTDLLNEQTDAVVISCTNWRNPLIAEIVEGFAIRTYDVNGNPIDFVESFDYDGTSLTLIEVDDSTFLYDISSNFPRDESDKIISFELSNSLETNDGCYVKITFPDEIDISNVNLTDIQGSGLLADADGNE